MAYILTKKEDKMSLYSTPDFEGYNFKPKKDKRILSVNKLMVVDPTLVDNILSVKFKTKFQSLLKLSQYIINNEDASEADTALALDEVSLLKSILLNRYQKFLSKEKELLFLQKLRLIENELRSKQMLIRMNYIQSEEQYYHTGKSR